MQKQQFYHLKMNTQNTAETLSACEQFLDKPEHRSLFFLNAHCFNLSLNNPAYKSSLDNCDLLLNDGIGIKIASKLASVTFNENMNGTDFIPKLLNLAAKKNRKVFLLGGKEGIANKAKAYLRQIFPNIEIAGMASGYFDDKNEKIIIDAINKSEASILVIGMGVPLQELWITRNKDRLPHIKISVAGGAILDFLSGNVTRAPKWVQKIGMEWLFRFLQEPRRLFTRYFIGNFVFFFNIARHKIYRA